MNDKYLLVWIMTHALAKFHVLDPHHAKKRNASLVSLQISPEMHHTWGRHKRHDSGLHMAAHVYTTRTLQPQNHHRIPRSGPPEFSEDLRDGATLDAAAQHLIELPGARGDPRGGRTMRRRRRTRTRPRIPRRWRRGRLFGSME